MQSQYPALSNYQGFQRPTADQNQVPIHNITLDQSSITYPLDNSFQAFNAQNVSYAQPMQSSLIYPEQFISKGQPLETMHQTNYMDQAIYQPQAHTFIGVQSSGAFNIDDFQGLPNRADTRLPQRIRCGTCQRSGVTTIKHVPGTGAFSMGLLLCCCGMWACAFAPCLNPDCMDVHHTCSNCGAVAGENRYLCDK